jgi:cell division protein FtsI/penicillin-binding protein 2
LERGGRVYDHITWFASYGPAEARYAVVVMVQSGSSGGGTCGPIAAKIYRALQYREQQAPAARKNIFANN